MEPLMFLISLPFAILFLIAWAKIFKKAGHSGWMWLLMIIPLVNAITFLVFAFTKWPIEDRIMAQKSEHTLPF